MSPGGFPGSTPGGDGGSEGMRTQTGGAMGRYDIAEPCSVDPLTDLVTFRAKIIESDKGIIKDLDITYLRR